MNKSGGTIDEGPQAVTGPKEIGKGAVKTGQAASWQCGNDSEPESGDRATLFEIDEREYSSRDRKQSFHFTQQLLTTLHDGILVYDRHLRHASWNPFLEELTGLKHTEVVGKHCLAIFPSLRSQGVYGLLERSLAGESFSEVEQYYYSPLGGRAVWISGRLTPLRDSRGDIIGVVGVVHDITQRKHTEEVLLRNYSLLRAVVEGATDAVFVKDAAGRYLMINGAGAQFLGKSVAEVIGRDDAELFAAEEARQIIAVDRSIMENGSPLTIEEVGTAGGSRRTYHATKWPWRDAQGNVIGVVGIARDITERRQAEEEVRQSRSQYEALVESIDGIVWEADPRTLRFSFVSKQAERVLGFPVQSWIDEASFWADHLHPEDRERALRSCADAVRENRSRDLVYRMIAKDGRTVWLRDIVAVTTENGVPVKLRGVMVDISRHKEADMALLASEERLRTVVANVPIVLFALDRQGVFTLSEGKGLELLGVAPGEAVGQSLFERQAATPQLADCFYRALSGESFPTTVDVGGLIFDAWCGPLRDAAGEISGVMGVAMDVTDYNRAEATRKSLEQQLVQAQKMESIGRLAGGVAHDFNNMLTAIMGYGQLLLSGLGEGHPLRREVVEILGAGSRAASLTRQLLALGRRQELVRISVDINSTIADLSKMLGRIIGEDIELRFAPGAGLSRIDADAGQVEQVLMNLAVNARDAMPSGGSLAMETRQVKFDEDYCAIHPWARPGEYVQISISDTGEGMDEETQRRMFEPFFTTKERDKGSGLGLAVVYGIVEQHHGLINVYSQVGFGSTFNIYLPISEGSAGKSRDQQKEPPPIGTETLLLAEDDPALRDLAMSSLQKLGYKTLLAENGEDAVRVYGTNHEQIDLLVLDWVMPKVGGLEAYRRIRARFGDVPVLFVTGYAPEIVQSYAPEGKEEMFLHKPYGLDDLGRRVRELLDQSRIH